MALVFRAGGTAPSYSAKSSREAELDELIATSGRESVVTLYLRVYSRGYNLQCAGRANLADGRQSLIRAQLSRRINFFTLPRRATLAAALESREKTRLTRLRNTRKFRVPYFLIMPLCRELPRREFV